MARTLIRAEFAGSWQVAASITAGVRAQSATSGEDVRGRAMLEPVRGSQHL
jgi:hypothetical protein